LPRFEPHPERRPAIVTGASSGIGAATAEALAAAGHPVVLGARRVHRCEAIASKIQEAGFEAAAFRLDLGDDASIKDFAGAASEAFGAIEVLVSNAGDTQLGHAADMPTADFEQQIKVNLLGTRQLVSLFAPGMIDRHRGDLVFVTTDGIDRPRPGMAAYLTAKFGVEGYARILQMELEGTGVRASIVRPGPTGSEMGSDWDPEALAPLFDEWTRFGMARHDCFLRPADVASTIAAVVSMPRGSHVTLLEVQPEAPGPRDLQGGGTR
jgi:NAD(P)-dependent dehydrogenase (short-subunit alcohol dehydrogenase family)